MYPILGFCLSISLKQFYLTDFIDLALIEYKIFAMIYCAGLGYYRLLIHFLDSEIK
jgi:hypothetical protein